MKHRCPIPNCTAQKLVGHLLCFDHWYQVPPELREEIWQAQKHSNLLFHEFCCRKAIEHVTALDI